MKRNTLLLLLFLFTMTLSVTAQSFDSMWKEVDQAKEKDLPKTAIAKLEQIISAAEKQQQYGHLLKAQLERVSYLTSITPDSLNGEVDKLVKYELSLREKDPLLDAVYCSVLGNVYKNNTSLSKDARAISADYFQRSLQQPELLAKHKTGELTPLLSTGTASRLFDDDLLHVLANEAGNTDIPYQYYQKSGNRVAAMFTSLAVLRKQQPTGSYTLNDCAYLKSVDSLMAVYEDLSWAGEIAYERYRCMRRAKDSSPQLQYDYLQQAIERWKDWDRVNMFKNELNSIIFPFFNAEAGLKQVRTDEQRVVKITSLRNVPDLILTLTRVDIDGREVGVSLSNDKEFAKLKKKMHAKPFVTQRHAYYGQPEWKINTDSFMLDKLPKGVYLLELTSTNKSVEEVRQLLCVSDLYVMCEAWPEAKLRYTVVNACTGKPVANASLQLSERSYKGEWSETFTTDKDGQVIFTKTEDKDPDEVWASTGDDKAFIKNSLNAGYSFYTDNGIYTDLHMFTDRALYRPGQTVHVALFVNKRHPDNSTPVEADKRVELQLVDANYKTVEKKVVVTDRYGTASADFLLPEKTLTGRFMLRASGLGSVSFNVEEYKRPTFFVEFDNVEGQYKLGDTLTVTGKAKSYAGVPVQNAKVKYTIASRQASWWRYYYNPSANRQVADGELVTDEKGEFKVQVPLVIPPDKDEEGNQTSNSYRHINFYDFNINVDVTDVGGETHHGYKSIPIGTRPTVLTCDLPDREQKDSLRTISFAYRNAAGNAIEGKVNYWFDDDAKVYTADANSPVDITAIVKKLTVGKHTLHAICGNDTLKEEIILFSMRDTKPCYTTPDWFFVPKTTFSADGKPLKVQFGSSDNDVYVFYSAMAANRLVDHGVVTLSNAVVTREYTYKEEYGDGILLTFAWVKDGKMYSHEVTLTKPLPDKRLNVTWKTFRNRLEPGQQEIWTATVTYPDGKPADAQLMAVMYDKSLDQIKSHGWNMSHYLRRTLPNAGWEGLSWQNVSLDWMGRYPSLRAPGLYYSHFDTSLFRFYASRVYNHYGAGAVMYEAVPMVNSTSRVMRKAKKGDAKNLAKEDKMSDVEETSEEEQTTPTDESLIRENLAETAFFFPALNTDEKGDVVMQFTLPESLTTWKFMAVAHDVNTNYGFLRDEIVAQKKVMIQPNMPRFLRANDKATITARLINTTEKDMRGKATLELLNPETRQLVKRQTVEYNLKKQDTQPVSFTLQLSDDTPIYICRIVAQGEDHSDGEQHYLAVLPDKELVTNTYPFTMHKAESKVIDLTKLFAVNDSTTKLTMEYTNNPAWLILQSLPTYSAPDNDNAIDQAVSYYVNTLGQYIANQAPHLRSVIQLWQQEESEETSLMSALEKNETLKNLVLNETPWVLDADKESAQKRKLIKFFDEPTMQMRLQTAQKKLSELQLSNGAWTWWKGMQGSIYMTVSITTMLERLRMLTGTQQPQAQQMLDKAYPFIDEWLREEYKEMRKAEKKGLKVWRPSETVIDILYLNALTGRSLNAKTAEAAEYMVKKMENRTTEFTIYGKAVAAFILAENNRKKKADEYLQSIEEYSVYTEEMGRYYDSPKAYYSWYSYKIPTQVAVIEAFKKLKPEQLQTIEELQRWLLQAKRTQAWNTPINSVNAIYAFLQGNMKTLDSQDEATFLLNDNTLETSTATAGMGYVKATHKGTDMKTLTVNKTSDGTSWGAVYAQFMQNTKDIEQSTAELSVKREIVGSKNSAYKVGDKITVRITITAQRDYDFVQVVDKRAACMEPVKQLSGYHWGYYIAPRDNSTCYYFDKLRKGTHVIESEYYLDRPGQYQSGTCTAQCAYAPEYAARDMALLIEVSE